MKFTDLTDLAAEKVGGLTLLANDEFFAAKENLLKASTPVFIAEKFTDLGKWMDGWETRRNRKPGYDWCIIQLGIPGIIAGVDVWTAHFKGNYPEHCSIEACEVSGTVDLDTLLAADWQEILSKKNLQGDFHNLFDISSQRRWTHLRLNIFPDGGVARFRVYGSAVPDWSTLERDQPIELSSLNNGGRVLLTNDNFFSPKENLILPTQAANMGEGWETRRRREPGYDWVMLQLGVTGKIQHIEVDTAHFKGNFPDACSIDACRIPGEVPDDFLASRSITWTEILPAAKLEAHKVHRFGPEHLQGLDGLYSHIRLNIYPDGGISRLRIWGTPSYFARFNSQTLPALRADLERCCGATEWVEQMLAYAPFESPEQVYALAEQVADELKEADWLEAFEHHPRIGDLAGLTEKYGSTADLASKEQAGSDNASDDTLQALATANQSYYDKFGFIFIVCATGKSAEQMLALLQERLPHDRDTELRIAAGEQRKITQIRLEQML